MGILILKNMHSLCVYLTYCFENICWDVTCNCMFAILKNISNLWKISVMSLQQIAV